MQFGLIEALKHWGTYRPENIAVVSTDRQITYSALLSESEHVARAIRATGQGHRVALVTTRKASFVTALAGVMRAGRSVVVLNPRLAEEAFRVTVQDTVPDILVSDQEFRGAGIAKAVADLPRVTVDEPGCAGTGDLPWPSTNPGDEWGVVFSSGSTGVPKGIVRDHESMVTEIIGWSLELPLTRNSVYYVGRPLFYTGGLVLTLATLFAGGSVIANDYYDDDDPNEVLADYIRESQEREVDWAFFVPDQLRALTKARPALSSPAKSILVMGDQISGSDKQEARKALGSQIVESWGNSESLGTITQPEDLDERPDSSGRPFLTDELFVVDEDYQPCDPGEVGQLAGAETAGFSEYANRLDATKAVKREMLIVSDDVGYVDEDGYFYIKGRVQDVLVRGDTTVFLPEVARKLRNRPEIAEVEVCSFEAASEIQLAAALVVSQPVASTASEYCQLINDDLALAEQLSRVTVLEAFPRLPSGKVDRLELRRLVTEQGQNN